MKGSPLQRERFLGLPGRSLVLRGFMGCRDGLYDTDEGVVLNTWTWRGREGERIPEWRRTKISRSPDGRWTPVRFDFSPTQWHPRHSEGQAHRRRIAASSYAAARMMLPSTQLSA